MAALHMCCGLQVMKERTFGSSWAPSVVVEGRVARKIGALFGTHGDDSRFLEMYVHDAMFGGQSDDATVGVPEVAAASRGELIHLPAGTSNQERARVVQLYDQLFEYVKRANKYVQMYVGQAEELANRDPDDLDTCVLA